MRPKIYHATDHDIDPSMLDPDALFVLHKLTEAGFTAYLVGGSVRDLLVKRTPKDFDISTSAKPEEIKKLFRRNCLLIGRRFRLAHIRFGKKVLEVSTFRSGDNESDLIIRDNQWGTPEEDVLRRDFTINGLFYDPANHVIIDYVGGWDDIHNGILRTIGDPETRFKQDPVRMIRAIKFRARFGFNIEDGSKKALLTCRDEIVKSSPARVLEEVLRMLESGSSNAFFQLLQKSGLLELLFPLLNAFLKSEHSKEILDLLASADQVIKQNNNFVERSVLVSCLLYPLLKHEVKKHFLNQDKTPHLGEIIMLTGSLVRDIVISSFSHFPKKLRAETRYILSTQYRFTPFTGKKPVLNKIMKNKEFTQALIFFKIRTLCDKELVEPYNYWTHQYRLNLQRGEKIKHHNPPPKRKPRYVRRKRT